MKTAKSLETVNLELQTATWESDAPPWGILAEDRKRSALDAVSMLDGAALAALIAVVSQ